MSLLWLTRPQADSEAFAAMLAPYRIETLIAPVMRIEPVAIDDFGGKPDGILLTSRHAVTALNAVPADWRSLPVACVGEATAAAARAAGFPAIIEGGGDALSLAKRVSDRMRPGTKLLYLCGEETRIDLPALLRAKNIVVESCLAYRALAVTSLPPALIEAANGGKIGAALFFSPRSAQIARARMKEACIEKAAADMTAYCLSVAVAEAAGSWGAVKVAASPTAAAMTRLIAGEDAPDENGLGGSYGNE
jgi:uroporphyrinogen-III synthase